MGKTKTQAGKLLEKYKKEGIKCVKIAITDIDGVMNSKYLTMDKFASILRSGGTFCDVVFGWDLNDQLYDNTKFTGWHTGYPDAAFKLDISTERRLVEEKNIPFFIGELVSEKRHEFHPVCPRNILKRILATAKNRGFGVNLAFEYEFFIFDETPHTLHEKNFRNLTPLTPGNFGYSLLRCSTYSDMFNDFMEYFESLNCRIEGLHCETGPGVWEAAILYDEALRSCDKAEIFKTFTKVFFQKRNLVATFMAKWSLQQPGQSGHVHMSIFNHKTGKPLFHDPERRGNMSELMEQFMAGQIKYMKPFLVMTAPTINSYTRLVKGAWAPTGATWGIDNRTTALRTIPGNPKAQRVEYRIAAADGNPYLVAAGAIASGLLGIEQKLELTGEIRGNAYDIQDSLPDQYEFPGNLLDSTRNFAASKEAKEMLGREFVEHYVATREWEVREYQKCITDWQMQRYFEII